MAQIQAVQIVTNQSQCLETQDKGGKWDLQLQEEMSCL